MNPAVPETGNPYKAVGAYYALVAEVRRLRGRSGLRLGLLRIAAADESHDDQAHTQNHQNGRNPCPHDILTAEIHSTQPYEEEEPRVEIYNNLAVLTLSRLGMIKPNRPIYQQDNAKQ